MLRHVETAIREVMKEETTCLWEHAVDCKSTDATEQQVMRRNATPIERPYTHKNVMINADQRLKFSKRRKGARITTEERALLMPILKNACDAT